MTRNLRKEMESYTNTRIINNIKQHQFYSPESVALAKEIAKERGILTNEQINSLAKLSDIQNEARELRDKGYEAADVERQMSRKYNNTTQTKAAVNQGISSSKNNSSSGIGVLGGIFIVFMIIKFFIRLAQYSSY